MKGFEAERCTIKSLKIQYEFISQQYMRCAKLNRPAWPTMLEINFQNVKFLCNLSNDYFFTFPLRNMKMQNIWNTAGFPDQI